MIQLRAAWAVLSSTWERVLPFAIKHWKILLILALSIALFLKMQSDYRSMETAYQTRIESSQAQIEGLKVIHETQLREQQLLMESFLESIAAIEEEYEKTREELERERNRKINKIEREWSEHPEGVAEQIEQEFGFEYVE
jgi:septal ring factor EnvC (AmiA/AmiB activator)|tara:strand:+ start:7521 stop:7940 length:420 start_codon:yes stop_codon:yes gene_type:complete